MNTLAFLVLSATLALPAGEEKEAPKDLDKLQGVWKVTAVNSRGKQMPAALFETPTYTLAVVGDRYVFTTHGGTVKLDSAKKTVDLEVTAGRYKGTTLLGRYEIKGDTFTLMLPSPITAAERVPELKAGDDPVAIVYTLQRDAKAGKEQAAAVLKDHTEALPDLPAFGGKGIGGKGAPAGGGFGGGGFAPAGGMTTQQMLQQILQRLERIEQRLDELEKRLPPREEKK
jgi:uncharacterized protein (TIGR03067 family)